MAEKMDINETEKNYHIVIGIPEALNKERVTMWLEKEADTVVLLSQREGCSKIYEMRFRPNGQVICNSIKNPSAESNFRWV